jgi:hypothetical protein
MKRLSDFSNSIIPKFTACVNCNNGFVQAECKNPRCLGGPVSHEHLTRCPCFRAHQERVKAGLMRGREKA